MPSSKDIIVAESPIMKALLRDVAKVASSNASVFITGESGTGKEVLASAIHRLSPRAAKPFVRVNCAAIPESLLESEFFGHEKGAFTGALQRRLGRFELAHLGSLLLDEISEVPLLLQPKLLRVLQELEFERVGGSELVRVDVRIISTSNRDMHKTVEQKLFREDLFFRLHVVPLHIPPLRKRIEDIIPLAEHFLTKLSEENKIEKKTLSSGAKERLQAYPWPGNVRELANVMERTLVLHSGSCIEACDLKVDMGCPSSKEVKTPGALHTLASVEEAHILETLKAYGNNKTKAAKSLGISLRTLRSKINGK